jgi:SAM-dependent methyltransferase
MQYSTVDFARLFGVAANAMPKPCLDLIAKADFSYEEPSPAKRDEIILGVLRHIDSGAPTQVGPQREDLWERCWAENLEKFVGSQFELEALVPKFIKPDQPVRLHQRYVVPRNPAFELAFFQVCRAFYFQKYFAGLRSVYEFGCGTGFNLVALAQQMPGTKLYGLDWSHSACEMVNLIGQRHKLDISGVRFDFFNPDRGTRFDAGSAVMTMCALEQLGPRHGAFLGFLLEKKPAICLNMEPIEELYDENNLADYLALRYHRTRGYLSGFLPRLKDLEAEGRVKILEVRRMYFGSLYHEGYSFVVWQAA